MAKIEVSYVCINGKYYKIIKTTCKGYADSESITTSMQEVDYNDIKQELIENEVWSCSN